MVQRTPGVLTTGQGFRGHHSGCGEVSTPCVHIGPSATRNGGPTVHFRVSLKRRPEISSKFNKEQRTQLRSGPIVGIGDTLELFTLLQIDDPSSLGFREIPPPHEYPTTKV